MNKFPFPFSIILFVLILIFGCSTTPKLKGVESSLLELNAQTVIPTDSFISSTINPYKIKMEKIMDEVLAYSKQPLLKELPESSLGNFVTDAVLKKTNDLCILLDNPPANICLLNNGGLRGQLPKGKITRGNAFELMPFENSIVVLTLTAEKTRQLFEYIVENNGAPFSGARVKAKGKKITELKINGKELDATKQYKVATSDYLATGGDKYNFFKDPIKIDTLNYKLRDAIIDYMTEKTKKGDTLDVTTDGRIKYEQ